MKIVAVRVDNAAEFKSLLEEWVKTEGVVHQPTAAHKHNQNGLVERTIQTAEGDMRAMLIDAKLPIEFWDEAVEAHTYVRNRLPGGVGLSTPDYTSRQKKPTQGQRISKPTIYAHLAPNVMRMWIRNHFPRKPGQTSSCQEVVSVCLWDTLRQQPSSSRCTLQILDTQHDLLW